MSSYKQYEYENELSIDPKLLCPICLNPFDNPQITSCKHIFCYDCIKLWFKKSSSCPTCRQLLDNKYLKPLKTSEVLDKLDHLDVKCLLCQQNKIQRKDFPQHIDQQCLKVSLSSSIHSQINNEKSLSRIFQLENLINQYPIKSTICLRDQQITDNDISIIIQSAIINKQCKILDLSYNQINSSGILQLFESLINNCTLKFLSFHKNLLSELSILYLSDRLSLNNCVLKWLDLESTNLNDISAEYLSIMLSTNTTLTGLWLSNNHIGYYGVQFLTSVLINSNRTLKYLDLENNSGINDSCLNCLMNLIERNQSLKKLYLNNCGLSLMSKTILREMAKKRPNFHLHL